MLTIIASADNQLIHQNEKLTVGTMADKYEDKDLIRLLCGDIATQEKAVVFIMSDIKTNIIAYLLNKGCAQDRVESFFLEGLTKGIHSIRGGKYRGDGSLEGFLKVTCYHAWLSVLRSEKARKTREKKIGTLATADMTADDLVFYEQRALLLKEFLQDLGAGCSEIMLLKAEGYSSKEIVEMTDYSSVSAVDRRYSVCMKKVRTQMKDKPHVMKLLKELYEK